MEFTSDLVGIPNDKIEIYQEFCKLSLYNRLLTERLEEIKEEKHKLESKYNALKNVFPNGKPKRIRRNANQIKRIFNCVHCDKSYGSEASLKNHLKYKHSTISEN